MAYCRAALIDLYLHNKIRMDGHRDRFLLCRPQGVNLKMLGQ